MLQSSKDTFAITGIQSCGNLLCHRIYTITKICLVNIQFTRTKENAFKTASDGNKVNSWFMTNPCLAVLTLRVGVPQFE